MPRGLSRSLKKDLLASHRGRERIYKRGSIVKALKKGGEEQAGSSPYCIGEDGIFSLICVDCDTEEEPHLCTSFHKREGVRMEREARGE